MARLAALGRADRLIDSLDSELAAGLLTFDEGEQRARILDAFPGGERWRAFARLRSLFSRRLQQLHLDDPHERRRMAVKTQDLHLPPPLQRVILMGCADLNPLASKTLDRVRGCVTALIHATQTLSGRFDRFGSVLTSEWQEGPEGKLNLTVVDGPAEQAPCVAAALNKAGRDS